MRGNIPARRSVMFRRSCLISPPRSRRPTPRRAAAACPAWSRRSAPAISASSIPSAPIRCWQIRRRRTGQPNQRRRPTAPAEPTEDAAPHANPAETGRDRQRPVAPMNTAQVTEDLDAAIAEMEALIAANPDLFSGLTVDDAEEIVHQIQLELAQINEGDVSPGAAQGHGSDITDIVDGRYRSGKHDCASSVEFVWTARWQQRSPRIATNCHHGDQRCPGHDRNSVKRPRSSSITAIRARPNR